jgi:hypothetical protein
MRDLSNLSNPPKPLHARHFLYANAKTHDKPNTSCLSNPLSNPCRTLCVSHPLIPPCSAAQGVQHYDRGMAFEARGSKPEVMTPSRRRHWTTAIAVIAGADVDQDSARKVATRRRVATERTRRYRNRRRRTQTRSVTRGEPIFRDMMIGFIVSPRCVTMPLGIRALY